MPILRFFRTFLIRTTALIAAYIVAVLGITAVIPPPDAVGMDSEARSVEDVSFLADTSWIDDSGNRHLKQRIFDEVFSLIEEAHQFLLIDMFLFNDWQGPAAETHRGLSSELTEALVARKQQDPTLPIVFITDPVNSIYRGLDSSHLIILRNAGILVVESDLSKLQDSNPLYSGLWRTLIKPFGNVRADTVKNPLGDGRVSLRSVLTMANFKANHRKLIIAGRKSGSNKAIVMSANPHDGSSAHRNVALSFTGSAVNDLLQSELALLTLSAEYNDQQTVDKMVTQLRTLTGLVLIDQAVKVVRVNSESSDGAADQAIVQVLTESRIRDRIIQTLDTAGEGANVDLLMFYLSDRGIIAAMKGAQKRGANLRVLLDVNKDAFGRTKNGVPNRPVATELEAAGISVKWCATKGEQCHAKMLLWSGVGDEPRYGLLLGSGNYTRRNLQDFNLETNVLLEAAFDHEAIVEARQYFVDQWQNDTPGRNYSYNYEEYSDTSWRLKLEYRLREASGFGTF
ncbi:MAG: phospholipase D-like domain-containing protein [Granulosicoccaceae bacterium]